MSWLFGSSKKKVDESSKHTEAVKKNDSSLSSWEIVSGPAQDAASGTSSTAPLYPVDLREMSNAVNSLGIGQGSNHKTAFHPLDSIPFKFASSLRFDDSDIEESSLELLTIMNNLMRIKEDLNSNCYVYDFKVERNVIQEMSVSNGH